LDNFYWNEFFPKIIFIQSNKNLGGTIYKISPKVRAMSADQDPDSSANQKKRVSTYDDEDGTVLAGALKTIEKRMDILNESSKSHAKRFVEKSIFVNTAQGQRKSTGFDGCSQELPEIQEISESEAKVEAPRDYPTSFDIFAKRDSGISNFLGRPLNTDLFELDRDLMGILANYGSIDDKDQCLNVLKIPELKQLMLKINEEIVKCSKLTHLLKSFLTGIRSYLRGRKVGVDIGKFLLGNCNAQCESPNPTRNIYDEEMLKVKRIFRDKVNINLGLKKMIEGLVPTKTISTDHPQSPWQRDLTIPLKTNSYFNFNKTPEDDSVYYGSTANSNHIASNFTSYENSTRDNHSQDAPKNVSLGKSCSQPQQTKFRTARSSFCTKKSHNVSAFRDSQESGNKIRKLQTEFDSNSERKIDFSIFLRRSKDKKLIKLVPLNSITVSVNNLTFNATKPTWPTPRPDGSCENLPTPTLGNPQNFNSKRY
jgi:hypothetical protein